MTQTNPVIQCVGIVCWRGPNVLLIRRKTPPMAGRWSIPGGHIEPGESQMQAALRELKEETGVTAKLLGKIACITTNIQGRTYNLHDYAARWVRGSVKAGDDADQADFFAPKDLKTLDLWEETRRVIIQSQAFL